MTTQHTPEIIYLQWYGDEDPSFMSKSELQSTDPDGASWCIDRIFEFDIEYIRADRLKAIEQDNAELSDKLAIRDHNARAEAVRYEQKISELEQQRDELLAALSLRE